MTTRDPANPVSGAVADADQKVARINPVDPQQPVGGAIIDANGREIPITEHMIRNACTELEKDLA